MAKDGIFIEKRADKQLMKNLDSLSGTGGRRVVRNANTKAIRPTRLDVKRRVRNVSRVVARAIYVKTKTYKSSGTVVSVVAASTKKLVGADGERMPSNVLGLIEFGTAPHVIRATGNKMLSRISDVDEDFGAELDVFGRTVQHPGAQPNPVLRPAFAAKKGEMIRIHDREVGAGIVREFKKGLKK